MIEVVELIKHKLYLIFRIHIFKFWVFLLIFISLFKIAWCFNLIFQVFHFSFFSWLIDCFLYYKLFFLLLLVFRPWIFKNVIICSSWSAEVIFKLVIKVISKVIIYKQTIINILLLASISLLVILLKPSLFGILILQPLRIKFKPNFF